MGCKLLLRVFSSIHVIFRCLLICRPYDAFLQVCTHMQALWCISSGVYSHVGPMMHFFGCLLTCRPHDAFLRVFTHMQALWCISSGVNSHAGPMMHFFGCLLTCRPYYAFQQVSTHLWMCTHAVNIFFVISKIKWQLNIKMYHWKSEIFVCSLLLLQCTHRQEWTRTLNL